jgi:hypothetical protein
MPKDHWLPGFNFNVEEWFEGADAGDLPHDRPVPRGVRGCDRREASRPVHDQEQPRVVKRHPEGDW